MRLDSLLGDGLVYVDDLRPSGAAKKLGVAGCTECPLNKRKHKLKEPTGVQPARTIMVWALNPTPGEAQEKAPLSAGFYRILWRSFKKYGIERRHISVDYVVRCSTQRNAASETRVATDKERFCCATHMRKMLPTVEKCKVHVMLGLHAARAVLGNESFNADAKAFWSHKLNSHVVVLPDLLNEGIKGLGLQSELDRGAHAVVALLEADTPTAILDSMAYRYIPQRPSKVRAYFRYLKTHLKRFVAIDIEDYPDPDDPERRKILCIGFSRKVGSAEVLFVDHPGKTLPSKYRKAILKELANFFEDSSIVKVFHYGAHDVPIIEETLNCKVVGYELDTAYSCYFEDPSKNTYGLQALATRHYPEFYGFKSIVDPYLKGEGKNYSHIPWEILLMRNAGDVDITRRLALKTWGQKGGLMDIYIGCSFSLKNAEDTGIAFDYRYFYKLKQLLPKVRSSLYQSMLAVIPPTLMKKFPNFNPGSALQVASLLYDHLGIEPHPKLGRTTQEEHITMQSHPVCKAILAWRGVNTQISRYLGGYKISADMNGGFVKTIYHLTGAITGRLRSSGNKKNKSRTNLQNIASDKMVKNLLVSDPDWEAKLNSDAWADSYVFLLADYGQMELRVLAFMAKVTNMIKAFKDGLDIHAYQGAQVSGEPMSAFSSGPKRRMIKHVNFGIIYGLNPDGVYDQLAQEGADVTRVAVKRFYNGFFRVNPQVRTYMKRMRDFATRFAYVSTLFGFRRPIDVGGSEARGTYWANQAINTPIQGTAHQILLLAISRLHYHKDKYPHLVDMCLEVHDALGFRVKMRHLKGAMKELEALMVTDAVKEMRDKHGIRWDLPLSVDMSFGWRYGVQVDADVKMSLVELRDSWLRENTKVEAEVDSRYAKNT